MENRVEDLDLLLVTADAQLTRRLHPVPPTLIGSLPRIEAGGKVPGQALPADGHGCAGPLERLHQKRDEDGGR
jgi:hypothetical protein